MGRVSAPFGVKGWIKVRPFTARVANLLAYRTWWVGNGKDWREYPVTGSRIQGRAVAVKLAGCDDRDAAVLLRGKHVAVTREALPKTGANEFYWADLIGLKVVNAGQQEFGRVARILATGANEVLVVRGERERLIPFIAEVIRQVDLTGGVISVDWSADY
ncbi:MAG: ribosome maturation factor RimM [Betaproteobacteria bacterium]|nr:ribosome maturation factor RimM [Betaproteobacteria bacterium]